MTTPLLIRRVALRPWIAAPLLLLLLASTGAEGGTPSVADQIIEQIVKKFAEVSSLSYTVKRVQTVQDRQQEEKWTFRYRKPDHLRIDYRSPGERRITITSSLLFEYVPEKQYAARADLAKMPPADRGRMIALVMSPFAVPGLSIENPAAFLGRPATVREMKQDGGTVIRLEYRSPHYILHVDPARRALLRTEIFDDKGTLMLRTEAKNLAEIGPGFWLPREIRLTTAGPGGAYVRGVIYLSDMAVNAELPDALFLPPAVPGIRIQDLN